MIPPESYRAHPDWPELCRAAEDRLAQHGDLPRWQAALNALPDLTPESITFGDTITAAGPIADAQRDRLTDALRGLHPWRKGPFELFGVHIDTEWRSDWKWQRIAPALGSLAGQRVLDVGCGNGYFGWRLLAAGAMEVVGVDPSVLFYLQHQAISSYLNRCRPAAAGPWPNHLLPVTFEALPVSAFELVLSMGVIYHRPEPAEHVARLFEFTRPGGRLLLESLVVTEGESLLPGRVARAAGRYARMRNVSVIPSLPALTAWLEAAGFVDVSVLDLSLTTTAEQRSTAWMTFESLAESLDPENPAQTVEGFPAPVRAALLARRPGLEPSPGA